MRSQDAEPTHCSSPGLASLLPDGPLIAWLNQATDPVPGDLRIVAGRVSQNALSPWLAIANPLFLSETDLVVPTDSMFGGVPRASGTSYLVEDVQHFEYFKNSRTAAAIIDALLSDAPHAFQPITNIFQSISPIER